MLYLGNRRATRKPITQEPQEPKRQVEIYKDEEGQPKYAQGTCSRNNDCTPAGCGQEVCSDDPTLITACILYPNAPDPNIYACGCVEGKCVWYKR